MLAVAVLLLETVAIEVVLNLLLQLRPRNPGMQFPLQLLYPVHGPAQFGPQRYLCAQFGPWKGSTHATSQLGPVRSFLHLSQKWGAMQWWYAQ